MSYSILSLEQILLVSAEKMQQLLKLLHQETALLKKNNIDDLENLTHEKITLTEQIENNEQQRLQFLNEHSLDPNTPKQWLRSKRLVSIWDKIKDIAIESKRQNQINGLVINSNRNRIKTQIEILNTSSLPAADLVYSSSGESIKQRNLNSLARV